MRILISGTPPPLFRIFQFFLRDNSCRWCTCYNRNNFISRVFLKMYVVLTHKPRIDPWRVTCTTLGFFQKIDSSYFSFSVFLFFCLFVFWFFVCLFVFVFVFVCFVLFCFCFVGISRLKIGMLSMGKTSHLAINMVLNILKMCSECLYLCSTYHSILWHSYRNLNTTTVLTSSECCRIELFCHPQVSHQHKQAAVDL